MLHKLKEWLRKLYLKIGRGKKSVVKAVSIPECYDSIHTLMQLDWHNFNQTGDPKHLLKKGGNAWLIDLDQVQDKLQREFFDTFGVSGKYKEWYKANTEYHMLMAQSILKNDRSYRTLAHVAQAEANELLKDIQKGSLKDAAAAIDKDPATTSVFMFNSKLESLGKVRK